MHYVRQGGGRSGPATVVAFGLVLAAVAVSHLLAGMATSAKQEKGTWQEPVFDLDEVDSLPLEIKILSSEKLDGSVLESKGYPYEGQILGSNETDKIVLEDLTFLSEIVEGKRYEVSAYFSYPKGARKLPGLIWAGSDTRVSCWPMFCARRGYAAVSITVPSCPPLKKAAGEDDPKQTADYHRWFSFLRAVSFLQSRPEVDPERIGICGASSSVAARGRSRANRHMRRLKWRTNNHNDDRA